MKAPNLNILSPGLPERVEHHWNRYVEVLGEQQLSAPQAPEFLDSLAKVWACSDYVANICTQHPALINNFFESGDILRPYENQDFIDKLSFYFLGVEDLTALKKALREFRRGEMLRIFWRDLAGWANLDDTTNELSAMADTCVQQSLKLLHDWQTRAHGAPALANGYEQTLLVIAVGKLGGNELNLSSDIDLIFAYPERGTTLSKTNPISHERFFQQIGQQLIEALHQTTVDGFVFRVDMRLRPFGESGPLVISLDAMAHYYKETGRDWERYALIKARILTGHPYFKKQLSDTINEFVYMHYIDFSAVEALREMHVMIMKETKVQRLVGNVKLGTGGIREIEFTGQAYQLIHGGENYRLQQREILNVLALLAEERLLSKKDAQLLRDAYFFLRNTEHRLQAFKDQQTHQLPQYPEAQQRLAFSMGYTSWESFDSALQAHQENVHRCFQQIVARPQHEESPPERAELQQSIELIWLGEQGESSATTILDDMGFRETDEALNILKTLRESSACQKLSTLGHTRLDALMPILLLTVGATDQPVLTLRQLIPVIESITKRTAYLVLLLENPKALKQLVKLCAISSWTAEQLAHYPVLLGELLDIKRMHAPMDIRTLKKTLQQRLEALPDPTLDMQLECLSRFKLDHLFRVLAMDVTQVLPLMRVSDHLTNIATIILQKLQKITYRRLLEHFDSPLIPPITPHFIVVAYGKLGGIELGYGSDLDLVFLYSDAKDEDPQKGETRLLYTRLAQEMIRLLGAHTSSGKLYEVDMRLRPQGDSGQIVSSLSNFKNYQHQQAWTWEHQALVRARAISGPSHLIGTFTKIRKEVLTLKRDSETLREEVAEMRKKMRAANKPTPEGMFDLKQGIGGVADIEFIVQFCALKWAHSHPSIIKYPDNVRILEAIGAEGLLDIQHVHLLRDAYRAYRSAIHRLDLLKQPCLIPETEFREFQSQIIEIWNLLIG